MSNSSVAAAKSHELQKKDDADKKLIQLKSRIMCNN